MSSPAQPPAWLLLVHSIPPKPAYARARISLRLRRMGAVALKNAVYVLPADAETQENFHWLVREITRDGGNAFICEASFVGGLSDAQVIERFREARAADYVALAAEVRAALEAVTAREATCKAGEAAAPDADVAPRGIGIGAEDGALLRRLRSGLAELRTIDFHAADGSRAVEALLDELEEKMRTAWRTRADVRNNTPTL